MSVKNNYPTTNPALVLDFANSRTVDSRVSFSRNSSASFYNRDGILSYAPANCARIDFDPVTKVCKGLLIEEQRTNLLTYSEDFDNAAWLKIRSSITANATTAPDGTITADKLVEDTTANTSHYIYIFQSKAVSSITYANSIYVKAAERSQIRFGTYSAVGASYALFDLLAGTASATTNTGSFTASSAYITPVGNSWYRCTIVCTTDTDTRLETSLAIANGGSVSYTGDGTSGIYIWGAQLEAGSFATSYIPSSLTFTGRTSTGTYYGSDGLIKTANSGVARLNYNPTNLALAPKLLLEEQRTNLITYSENLSTANWANVDNTETINAAIAPDGTMTANKVINNNGVSGYYNKYDASVTAGNTYCISCFAKAGERTQFSFLLYNSYFGGGSSHPTVTFDLTNGTASSNGIAESYGIQSVGNGWYRCWIVDTCSASNTGAFMQWFRQSTAGDGTSGIYIWGAQLEQGSYPTSYIPTTTAQVTRSADTSTSAQSTRVADVATMTGTNFSSWYRADEGTLIGEMTAPNANGPTATGYIATISDGTNSGFISIGRAHSGTTNRFEAIVDANFVNQVYLNPAEWVAGATAKVALAVKANDCAFGYNGTVITDTSVSIPNVNRMNIGANMFGSSGYPNGCIRRIAYYRERLPNTQLQALTV